MGNAKFDSGESEKQVLKLLKETKIAVSTDFVAYHLRISWVTSKSMLLHMALRGLIVAEETTKGMIFRLPKTA